MLKTASSTLSCIAWLRMAASGADTFGSPSVCGDIGSTASTIAETSASTQIAGRTGRRHQHVVAAMMPQRSAR